MGRKYLDSSDRIITGIEHLSQNDGTIETLGKDEATQDNPLKRIERARKLRERPIARTAKGGSS